MRKNGCVDYGKYPGAPVVRSLAIEPEKRVRGKDVQLLECIDCGRQETSEGMKPKGATDREPWLNPRTRVRYSQGEQSPGVAIWRSRHVQLHEGHGV